jgi:cell shape-determining protein MreC
MEAPSKSSKSRSSKDRSSKDRSSKESKIKKSGVRTKFLIESLRNDYYALREENDRLRNMVTSNLSSEAADEILANCFDLNASKAKSDNIDELAGKMSGAGMDDDDDEEEE